MKKTFALFFLLLVVVLISGCKIEAPPESEEEKSLSDGLAEIEALEEEINLSELDEIDQLLEELELD